MMHGSDGSAFIIRGARLQADDDARVLVAEAEQHAERLRADAAAEVLSLRSQAEVEAATALVTSTQLFKLAESLGGIKSLVSHPAQMTHKSIPAEKRKAAGVVDGLIRLSAGLEDTEDLIEDLRQALDRSETAKSEAVNASLAAEIC